MAKSKKKAQPVQMKKKDDMSFLIDMAMLQHKAHPYTPPTFRGGAHMTEKDRPRRKKFYKEDYE